MKILLSRDAPISNKQIPLPKHWSGSFMCPWIAHRWYSNHLKEPKVMFILLLLSSKSKTENPHGPMQQVFYNKKSIATQLID